MENKINNKIESNKEFIKKDSFYDIILKEDTSNETFFKNKKDFLSFKENYLKRITLSNNLDKIKGNPELENILKEVLEEPENKRLILYLPFDLINNKSIFIETYKKQFFELIKEVDLREDFNFGDIKENTITQPKVNKACHLIPLLLEKNIFSFQEIFNIIEKENNPIIINSFCDTFNILLEKKLITEADLSILKNSTNLNIKNTIKLAELTLEDNKQENTKEDIFEQYLLELEKMQNKNNTNSIARSEWLKYQNKEELLNKYASLLSSNKEEETTKEILKSENAEELDLWVRYLENNNVNNLKIIEDLINAEQFEHKEKFIHLKNKITNQEFTNKYNTENAEKKIKEISKEIEKESWLKDKIYNVFLLNGSHLKGYADRNSDLDLSIFMKPIVKFTEREEIQKKLKTILNELKINASFLEFWLEEQENQFKIKTFNNYDEHLADNAMTYPLISPSYGNQKEIEFLQKSLIPYYLQSQEKDVLLKNSEHILLQYRLMHKGYYKNTSRSNILNSKFNSDVDGDSPFFDSGYRKLATKIYLEKIYL